MKKYLIILLTFWIIPPFAQITQKQEVQDKNKTAEFDSGSKISVELLNKIGNKKLQQLGMIWGFLKYYHPNIASGKYDWDAELFKLIPKLSDATPEQHDKIITDWIKGFGDFKTQSDTIPENLKMKADLGWITASGFSKELTDTLLKVKNAERKNKNQYVSLLADGNPEFTREKPYAAMISPDAGYRLLSL